MEDEEGGEREADDEDEDDEDDEEVEQPKKKAKKEVATKSKKPEAVQAVPGSKGGIAAAVDFAQKAMKAKEGDHTGDKEESDFEEVPLSDYSSDSEAMAETLALGTMMLRKKKKIEIINGGYNRYAYDDEALLPDWFKDEEMQHNKGSIPVTKEMVEAFKLKEKAINSRSIKKVEEAKGRKRKRATKNYEKLKAKANKMAESSETTFKDKMKLYEKLAKVKSAKDKRGESKYVVAKKGGGRSSVKGQKGKGGEKNTKTVDARMKKDIRGKKSADSKAKSNKKAQNKSKAKKSGKSGW
jgi:AdoMet-dependent rRNA methyltransferase SPB1